MVLPFHLIGQLLLHCLLHDLQVATVVAMEQELEANMVAYGWWKLLIQSYGQFGGGTSLSKESAIMVQS